MTETAYEIYHAHDEYEREMEQEIERKEYEAYLIYLYGEDYCEHYGE